MKERKLIIKERNLSYANVTKSSAESSGHSLKNASHPWNFNVTNRLSNQYQDASYDQRLQRIEDIITKLSTEVGKLVTRITLVKENQQALSLNCNAPLKYATASKIN